MKIKHINLVILPIAIGCASYATYDAVKKIKNYKNTDDLKTEIAQKAPKLYDSLTHDGLSRHSYIDWQYEVKRMNDSIKTDSIIQQAYFEGAQMVRDSIKRTERIK